MRTIVHLSDLHFGRTQPDLVGSLLRAVNGAAPDLVAVSGDLTQFRQARAFLDRVGAPCLVVPGNHDVPLDNLALRLFNPWRRYRRWIGTELEPSHRDEEFSVVGVNTVNPLDLHRGRIDRRHAARICSSLGGEPDPTRTRILVAHHPFAHAPGQQGKALMRGAGSALDALAGCGADVVLSGHLHTWRAEPSGPGAAASASRAVLLVQAGTGLSTRVRGEENDFNVLHVQSGEITVERFVAPHGALAYSRGRSARFLRGPAGWQPLQKQGAASGIAII